MFHGLTISYALVGMAIGVVNGWRAGRSVLGYDALTMTILGAAFAASYNEGNFNV